MATWNDRINDMLSRLEAAAGAQDANRPAAPRPRPQNPSYQAPQGFAAPDPGQAGPGSVARITEEQQKNAAATVKATPRAPAILPAFRADTLIQGVVFAEILGKPLARRRGRGRYGI